MYQNERAESPREAEKEKIIPSVQVALMYRTNSDDVEFFLLHRITGSFPDQWCFPGGKIDSGETLLQAACRETFEESGVALSGDDLTLIRHTEASTVRKINGESVTQIYPIKFFAIFIKDKTLAINASPDEHDAGRWFSSKEILNDDYIEDLNNGRVSLKPQISGVTKDSVKIALTCQTYIKQVN